MSEEQDVRELRRIVGLLEKTHDLARNASMTGALEGGKSYVLQQFNAIVANLAERDIVLPSYFPPLSPEASFDEIGIACAQLAEFLRVDLPKEETVFFGKGRRGPRSISVNVGNVPDLKQLGEVIRESMPEWLRGAREKEEEREADERAEQSDVESRLADVSARIQEVAQQMQREDLPSSEMQRLAHELSRLGREQAQIAREAARGGD
jgi:hypothetical protein